MVTKSKITCLKMRFFALVTAWCIAPNVSFGQVTLGTENGEWRYIGGTIGHTRYSPLDQINATNFNELEQAWIWRTDNYGPNLDYFSRSTPIYVDGIFFTN